MKLLQDYILIKIISIAGNNQELKINVIKANELLKKIN